MCGVSLNYLISGRQQRFRDDEVERLGGSEVDDKFVLGCLLDRQIGRLLSIEDAINVSGRAPAVVNHVRPVGDQTPGGDELALGEHRRQFVPSRKRYDQVAMN